MYSIIEKRISDKKVLSFTKILLDDDSDLGIPIGNYTSQFFANIYLNELDYYIKYDLRIKYYIRYMDDFVLLLNDKETCRDVISKIEFFLNDKLKLQLNSKSRYYPSYKGVDFCGYVIYESHIKLRKRFKNKINRYIRNLNRLYLESRLDNHKVMLSWNSFMAHSSHASFYSFMLKMYDKMIFPKTSVKQEHKIKIEIQ